MKQIFLILSLLIVSTTSVYSAGINICPNDDGSEMMTNIPSQSSNCSPIGEDKVISSEPQKINKKVTRGQSGMENQRVDAGQENGKWEQRIKYEKARLNEGMAFCEKSSSARILDLEQQRKFGAINDIEICKNRYKNSLRELEKNPGYYFYKKEERNMRPPTINVWR